MSEAKLTPGEIRERLIKGIPTIGTWLQLPSPDVAEIIGRMGYDWVAVDLEHGAFSRSDLPNIFRALEVGGTVPFARVLEISRSQIKGALDSGAKGLILPMVESRRQLDFAVAESHYPGGVEFDAGCRGVGYCRANDYGQALDVHTKPGPGPSRDIVIVVQIENIKAMHNLDSIFSHPRLDAYMVGPYDLSASMGLTGDLEHPDFKEVLAAIAEKAAVHNIPMGIHVVQPDIHELRARIKENYVFIAYGIDVVFLMKAAQNPLEEIT